MQHARRGPLGDPVGAGEVGVDDAGERLLAHPQQQRVVGHAGVGHQHLDRAELGLDRAERGVDLLGRRDVALHAEQALGRAAAAVGHGDPVAVRRERPRDRQADAAIAAGDQDGSSYFVLCHALDASGSRRVGYGRAITRCVRSTAHARHPDHRVRRARDPGRPRPARPGAATTSQVVMDVLAAGINYADTHQTENSYLAQQTLPLIPGGEVVVRGPDGQRLRRPARPRAATPSRSPPTRAGCSRSPTRVSDAQALTTLVQGATAWHLLRTSTHLQAGETVVVHAGAGGVGTIAIQLAKRWGAGRVIATASSEEKRALTPRARRRRRRRLARPPT